MFQPQPTPFTSSSFASYGLASNLDFAFPVSAGGGGTAANSATATTGYYNPSAPSQSSHSQLQSQSLSHTHQPQQQSHSHPNQHQQQPPQPQPQQHLVHQQHISPRQHQISSSSAAPSASLPYANSTSTSVSSQTSSSNSNPSSSPSLAQLQNHHLQHQHRQPQQQYPTQVVLKMEDQGQHGMAAQQDAARHYQPVLEGLKVGNKILSDVITNEYAKADPVYVEKTIALPQTYSHYRPILGDGNCGWRAIGFSYFEKLIESGDQAKIEGEVARLMSMNPLLTTVGNYPYWEEMAEEMLDHLREVAQNVSNPQYAHQLNHEKWNEPGTSDSMIYYLRLLVGTFIKNDPTTFEPFVTDGSGAWRAIVPSRSTFPTILLKPAGFVLEVAMLDRSMGSEVNHYRWPEEANGQNEADLGPIIYLLYRPGHYDVLYKSMTTQVLRVSGFTHNTNITTDQADLGQYTTMNFDALSIIPGFSSSAAMGGLAQFAPPPPASAAESFSPIQQSPWISSFPEPLPTPTPRAAPPPPPPIMASPQPPTPPASISGSSAMAPSPAMVSATGPQNSLPLRTAASNYHIRFSPVQLEYDEGKNSFPDSTFQVTTNTFKNSIWNRAHYCNPNFHPEEWNPDDEHTDGRVGSKRRPKKETF
ncbi:peptidase C65 Otubain-domain-containing protein [Fusarium venenatum]|uniref:peptidase C65 Otubain-domain-containing protein n=1 Tax=Fusarium venenatum TaxID=56646 RepID=UPI001DE116F3|nr:peptidase C65 Otubain-domain-containing protein [Fusarium venenatum]